MTDRSYDNIMRSLGRIEATQNHILQSVASQGKRMDMFDVRLTHVENTQTKNKSFSAGAWAVISAIGGLGGALLIKKWDALVAWFTS